MRELTAEVRDLAAEVRELKAQKAAGAPEAPPPPALPETAQAGPALGVPPTAPPGETAPAPPQGLPRAAQHAPRPEPARGWRTALSQSLYEAGCGL